MGKKLGTLAICGLLWLSSTPLLAQANQYRNQGQPRNANSTFRENAAAADYTRHQTQDHHGMSEIGRHEGWYRQGGNVPPLYRHHVVANWHRENLREPPRGYQWMRSDNGDFLLVATTTGFIAELLQHP